MEFRNSSSIPPITEVDVITTSLNELVQNMNDITDREKELQRQQVFTNSHISFHPFVT